MTAEKIDLFKQHKDEYVARKKPVLITAAKAQYLGVSGRGEPGGSEFQQKLGALYAMAYTIKMTRKFGGEQDYVVSKLEAQWWGDEGVEDLSTVPKDQWSWRMMIRTPGVVKSRELERARKTLADKGKGEGCEEVALSRLTEGRCVQMLHVGPYEREHETITIMNDYAAEEGWRPHGLHHEIYLSDPRRVEPARLKTILRRPVKRA